MFLNFKEKLKNVLKRISTSVEKGSSETKQEEKQQEISEPKKPTTKKKKIPQPIQKPQVAKDISHKEEPQQQQESQPEKKGFFSRIFKQKEEVKEEKIVAEQTEDKKKGILSRITEKIVTTHISEEQFDHLFNELELASLNDLLDKVKMNRNALDFII